MSLRLLPTAPASPLPTDGPSPFDLNLQPTRPGCAHEPVALTLTRTTAVEIEQHAAAAGLPAAAWAALAAEANRALSQASAAFGVRAAELEAALDTAAAPHQPAALPRGPGARLLAYASQLEAATSRPASAPSTTLALPVPYNSLLAWQNAAADARLPLKAWTASQLETPPPSAASWEAAAAWTGATLAEWVLLHAASSSS
jgi:hypothetical protein